MFPMLGREVVEGEQRLAVFRQALDGLVVLDAIGFGERIECILGGLPGLRYPDVLQCSLGLCLQALWQPVPRMSALCHVWTAPSWQGLSSRLQHWSEQPCVRPL